ncbi:nitroreductase family protein [Faecalitalea cylindroides]|uniref:nitroreductase family protein n=1 Tax=Faecalitalea cylindroides TaxID=39483 RepID=UPI00232CD988|nr:nitroreductase family protein [Faecalitalea cylindroides]MDB7952371.1 nitroreductase family protein [Faecalitalea cylindroides]MDB7959001.1 nitroreductase family protein [Faecalitalea cylindroides]MDB7960822.1 nitroreductase family protein [Faecalitalea cylindroides]MDB7962929.1 nitroreductase family protein [Faecalitalea cylindroides]MDB7964774.1 nitroreductase family protein [Faecalitalea cylindroides]
MQMLDLMKERHSVRQYSDKKIDGDVKSKLDKYVASINEESGLSMQIFYNEPNCFNSMLAHYGKFSNVKNYIAIVGKKEEQEKSGYYGEKLVLKCQELGLNTCWVALTHGKVNVQTKPQQKLLILIALGYGTNTGVAHKSKPIKELCKEDAYPEWFMKGMEAVSLAPTAMNQQKFLFEMKNGQVYAKALRGFYSKIDLGIVKYHFEAVTGHKVR